MGGTASPAAWHRFSGDRKRQHPKDHLARYRGWMHTDGYAGFEDLYRSGAIREVGKDPPPEAAMAPAVESVVDRRRRAAIGRTILPAAADPQHMDDAADDAAVIHPSRFGLIRRQKRLNRHPGTVRKPKPSRHCQILLSTKTSESSS